MGLLRLPHTRSKQHLDHFRPEPNRPEPFGPEPFGPERFSVLITANPPPRLLSVPSVGRLHFMRWIAVCKYIIGLCAPLSVFTAHPSSTGSRVVGAFHVHWRRHSADFTSVGGARNVLCSWQSVAPPSLSTGPLPGASSGCHDVQKTVPIRSTRRSPWHCRRRLIRCMFHRAAVASHHPGLGFSHRECDRLTRRDHRGGARR